MDTQHSFCVPRVCAPKKHAETPWATMCPPIRALSSLTSFTGPMIPMKTPIALHALLSFSHRFFTHYTVIANRFHICWSQLVQFAGLDTRIVRFSIDCCSLMRWCSFVIYPASDHINLSQLWMNGVRVCFLFCFVFLWNNSMPRGRTLSFVWNDWRVLINCK